MPGHVEITNRRFSKPPSVPPARNATWKYISLTKKALALPTEFSSMDTTRTPGSSEQVPFIMTDPVSPASPPNPEPISQFFATSTAVAHVPPATQAVVFDVDSPFLLDLLFVCQHPINSLHSFAVLVLYLISLTISHSFLVVNNVFKNGIIHILFYLFKLTTELYEFYSLNSIT